MIDVSPLLLWPAVDILELMPLETADSPRARRLAVLAAEAQAAGQGAAVLAWFCDIGRLLLLELPCGPGRSALVIAVTASEAVAQRGAPVPADVRHLLREICELEAPPASPAEAAADAIARSCLCVIDRVHISAEQAWHTATELLAALAHVAGDTADAAIGRCAELAYKRLFVSPARRS